MERIKRKHNNITHRRSKRIFLSNIAIYTSNILRFYAYLPKKILRFQKKVVPSRQKNSQEVRFGNFLRIRNIDTYHF